MSSELGVPRFVSELLAQRGLLSPEAAERYLRADLGDMPSPALLKDCERAATRLLGAIDAGERIVVYGDYDVDGVTSTALLALFFKHELGVELATYIPHRMREGYGLNCEAISRLAAEGARVLVTVDNGSSAVAEVAHANTLGLDVIILDHHQVSSPEPAAFAHLNPHRPACGFPEKVLAAVGVAFYLTVELRRVMRGLGRFAGGREPRPDRYLDLVALGTVADVAPLSGVNRALVRRGLELMRASPRPGLLALMTSARVDAGTVTARDLGYKLGPRVNAAGRMDDATRGLALLMASDLEDAGRLAAGIEVQNSERRLVDQEVTAGAEARVEALGAPLPAALVLADAEWHAGVLGIVASRLVEKFQRPTILLARDGAHFKGSARSPRGFHLKEALDACAPHLVRWGGHAAAAGLTLRAEALEAFTAAFVEVAFLRCGRDDAARIAADVEAGLDELSGDTIAQLERMGPFGEQNPAPVVLVRGVEGKSRRLGEGHLKLLLSPADVPREALGWGMAGSLSLCDGPVDLLCTPEVESYRGRRRVVLRLRDLRPAEA